MVVLVRRASQPLSQQIYEQIRNLILTNLLEPEDAIPPSRTLAEQLGVSRTIVVLAYERLVAEGYINGVRGSGTFVSKEAIPPNAQGFCQNRFGTNPALFRVREMLTIRPNTPPADEGRDARYDFRHGVPAWDQFPTACWRRLLVRAWNGAGPSTLGYGKAEGSLALRYEIARLLRQTRGIAASPDQIVITTGATQALSLLSTVLISNGDVALVEDPAHPVLRDIFRLAGASVVPVPVDDEGLCVQKITECLEVNNRKSANCNARLVYVTPSHQFPSGVSMSQDRKIELLKWASQNRAVVVEDDYDSDYRFDGQKTSALASVDDDGRVVFVGSFSKVLFPALRIGYACLPRDLIEPFLTAKWLSDRLTPTLEQEVLADFMQSGRYATHIRRMTRIYASKRFVLMKALRKEFGNRVNFVGVNAGLHLLIEIDSMAREADIATNAERLNVRVYPASPYYLGPRPKRASFLLGYGALSETQIEAGVMAFGCAERSASSL